MIWENLTEIAQIEDIKKESFDRPIAIFKHSTRCPISTTAKARFERAWDKKTDTKSLKTYYLDLIALRQISNFIAQNLDIVHESPQMIVLKNGEVVYHESHYGIDLEEILEKI